MQSIVVVPEISTLILLADKFVFGWYVFENSFSYPTPEFKNDKVKHNNTVNYTSPIGCHWSNVPPDVLGLCVEILSYPVTKSILKCILCMGLLFRLIITYKEG